MRNLALENPAAERERNSVCAEHATRANLVLEGIPQRHSSGTPFRDIPPLRSASVPRSRRMMQTKIAPPAAAPPLLAVEAVKQHFRLPSPHLGSPKPLLRALDGVSLQLAAGETLGLVGESGCGKSTLGQVMLRLQKPTAGQVYFAGTEVTQLRAPALRSWRRRFQYVFQDPAAALNPRMRAAAIISEGLRIHRLLPSRQARSERAKQLLADVGMSPQLADRYPHQLSGGQKQRLCLARALALDPQALVADEAVSALDVSVQAQVINLLVRIQEQRGLAYLFISHDLAVVQHISQRVAVMYLGRVIELASSAALFRTPAHPYTEALLRASPPPDPARAGHQKPHLHGEVPSAMHPPRGCAFHPRCPHTMAICTQVRPELKRIAQAHQVACHLHEKPAANADPP